MTYQTFVRRLGQGVRPALAIHCTLAHSGAWAGLAQVLGDRLTLTAFDLPGHGKSGPWIETMNLHDQATAMAAELLTEPMDLIAHSFGATVALRLAVERPHLVRSLCMIEPVYFAAAVVDFPERIAAHDKDMAPYIDAIAEGYPEKAAQVFNRYWGDGAGWEAIPAHIRDYMIARIRLVPKGVPMLYDDSAGLMAPGRMARAAMPAVLIEGENSIDAVDAINASLARRLPNVTRAVIKGAGHMAPLTHPREVAAEITQLLDRS